jgi:hypothetical protein
MEAIVVSLKEVRHNQPAKPFDIVINDDDFDVRNIPTTIFRPPFSGKWKTPSITYINCGHPSVQYLNTRFI